jgi:hypothetical protein
LTQFNSKPSPAYLAAVDALSKLDSDERRMAYADASAETNRKQWIERHGVKESSRFCGWRRLMGERGGVGDDWLDLNQRSLPGNDHGLLFNKNGKPEVYTFQPYGLGWETLKALIATCEANGLEAKIDTWPAWHFPGSILFVEVRRAAA